MLIMLLEEKTMQETRTIEMDPDVFDRISWSKRVVRFMGLGEVLMDVEKTRMKFSIRKKGKVTHSFPSLEQFERFATHSMDRYAACQPVTVSLRTAYASKSRPW